MLPAGLVSGGTEVFSMVSERGSLCTILRSGWQWGETFWLLVHHLKQSHVEQAQLNYRGRNNLRHKPTWTRRPVLNWLRQVCNIYIYIYALSIYALSRHFYPKRLTDYKTTCDSVYTFFCQYVCSLGFKPTTFALLKQCSNHWATGTLQLQRLHTCWR